MRKPGRMLGVLLLVALAGCASGVSVETSHDPLAVFPRQGTFAWAEGANVIPDEVADLGLADLLPPAVEDVHPSLSHDERRTRIEAALERLFKEFPP